jgi:hypothetical protein
LRKRKPDLIFPIIHAFFGDSASSNLDSEIAVFAEQCYQKRELLKQKFGRKIQKKTPARMDIRSVPTSKRSAESREQVKS